MSEDPRIEEWTIEFHVGHEHSYYRLSGVVYGHPRPWIRDGEFCYTSKLLRIDFENKTAETVNRKYLLGNAKDLR
jgi:hypothetical protein